jgi:predicted amidohydrolase
LGNGKTVGAGGPDARKFARVAGGALGLVLIGLFLLDYSCVRNELTILREESSLRQEVDKIMMYDTPLNEEERLFKARGYEVTREDGALAVSRVAGWPVFGRTDLTVNALIKYEGDRPTRSMVYLNAGYL